MVHKYGCESAVFYRCQKHLFSAQTISDISANVACVNEPLYWNPCFAIHVSESYNLKVMQIGTMFYRCFSGKKDRPGFFADSDSDLNRSD